MHLALELNHAAREDLGTEQRQEGFDNHEVLLREVPPRGGVTAGRGRLCYHPSLLVN